MQVFLYGNGCRRGVGDCCRKAEVAGLTETSTGPVLFWLVVFLVSASRCAVPCCAVLCCVQLDEEDKYSGVIREEDLMRMRAAQRHAHQHHHHPPHHSMSTSALPNHMQQNGGAAAGQGKPMPWRSGAAAQQQQQGGTPRAAQQQPAAPLPPGLCGTAAAAGETLGAPPGLPTPGSVSAPVSIPARPSATGSSGSGGGALVGSAHGSSPSAAWAGASSLDAGRKEVNKVSGCCCGAGRAAWGCSHLVC